MEVTSIGKTDGDRGDCAGGCVVDGVVLAPSRGTVKGPGCERRSM